MVESVTHTVTVLWFVSPNDDTTTEWSKAMVENVSVLVYTMRVVLYCDGVMITLQLSGLRQWLRV